MIFNGIPGTFGLQAGEDVSKMHSGLDCRRLWPPHVASDLAQ